MTFILGSRCSNGVLLLSDKRVTIGDGRRRILRDKLFQNVDLVVWGAAGDLAFFEMFKDRVKMKMQEEGGGRISSSRFMPMIEEVYAGLMRVYTPTFLWQHLQILIGSRISQKSELFVVGPEGGHNSVIEYVTIGTGSPYGDLFLEKLWNPSLTMDEVAVVGYFII